VGVSYLDIEDVDTLIILIKRHMHQLMQRLGRPVSTNLTALLDSPAVVVASTYIWPFQKGKITGMKSLSFRGHICKSYLKGTRLPDYA
jgi:hypothetical protein